MNTPFDPSLRPTFASDPLSRTPDTSAARDVVPPTERDVDTRRTGAMDSLTAGPSRPLKSSEREAARADDGGGERTYAPASARVPVPPAPGHEDMVSHVDQRTPERLAASITGAPGDWSSANTAADSYPAPSSRTGGGLHDEYFAPEPRNGLLWTVLGGSAAALAGMTVGGWLYTRRRQRERNRPINRARRTLAAVRQSLPERDELMEYVPRGEVARPASGVGAAVLTVVLPLAIRALSRQLRTKRSLTDRVRDQADHFRELSQDGRRVRVEDLRRPGWVKVKLPSRDAMLSASRDFADRTAERIPDVEVKREAGIGVAGALGLAAASYVGWKMVRGGRDRGAAAGIETSPTYSHRSTSAAD